MLLPVQERASKDRDGRGHTKSHTVTPLKLSSRSVNHQDSSPRKAGWWGRLLVAASVGFYINSVPIHLATATHLDDLRASPAEIASHHHGHDDGEDHGDTDHHVPHPASDHKLNLTAQTQVSNASAFVVLCLFWDNAVLIEAPQQRHPIPILERIKPPGESPPDPLQPRAPPLT